MVSLLLLYIIRDSSFDKSLTILFFQLYHLYPHFLQTILLPISLLAKPNNPVENHRLVPEIFCISVDPQVEYLLS